MCISHTTEAVWTMTERPETGQSTVSLLHYAGERDLQQDTNGRGERGDPGCHWSRVDVQDHHSLRDTIPGKKPRTGCHTGSDREQQCPDNSGSGKAGRTSTVS